MKKTKRSNKTITGKAPFKAPTPIQLPIKTFSPDYADSDEFKAALENLVDVIAATGVKGTNPSNFFKTSRRASARVLSYNVVRESSHRHNVFNEPIHDFSEIARAIDTESLLARSVQKHREYILKEGWELTGKDPEVVQYVKSRLFEIELATGMTFNEVLREIVNNIIMYSNAFILLARNLDKSSGGQVMIHGKVMDPICGLFPIDPVSIKVKQNKFGRPIKWRQEIEGLFREYSAEDVVALTIDKKSGFIFGTPYSVPVIDDIRTLRKLEELVEILSHKHLFPFFHVKVGTPEAPAQDIEDASGHLISEVDIAREAIETMPSEGGLVTSERYELNILGSEGKVLDLNPYLQHFMMRVMSGLRLSGLDLGQADTANKSSAQAVNRNLVDAVKDYQAVISDCLTSKLMDIIVLEGGYDLTLDNRVSFVFPTADREEERSQQNHGTALFQSNAISCTEFRREFLRKEPLTPEEEADTWYERYERPQFEAQLEAKMAAKASSGSKDAIKKLTAVKVRPRNQYGKSPSKPFFPANDLKEIIGSFSYTSGLRELICSFVSKKINIDYDLVYNETKDIIDNKLPIINKSHDIIKQSAIISLVKQIEDRINKVTEENETTEDN